VRDVQVGGQHHPVRAVEAEHVGGAAADGGLLARLAQVPGVDQVVDAGGDGGAGQPGELDEVPTRAGTAPTDQFEQLPGALTQVLTPSRRRRSGRR
jgi:hypothetical protein